jgi:hypothetical protein
LTDTHPVHALRARLEDERLDAVQRLAAGGTAPHSTALTELAYIQLALTAVREEIEAHSVKLGWGSEEALE